MNTPQFDWWTRLQLDKVFPCAIADRSKGRSILSDEVLTRRSLGGRVSYTTPSADAIEVIDEPHKFAMCGRDGQGPCPRHDPNGPCCYAPDGYQCPRCDACGATPHPGMAAYLGNFQEV